MFSIFFSLIMASMEDIQICWREFDTTSTQLPLKLIQALSHLKSSNTTSTETIKLLTELANDEHNVDAQCILGICYTQGLGVSRNYKLAFSWMSKTFSHDRAEVYKNLGIMYAEGIGTSIDYEKALLCLQKSVHLGNHTAERILGTYHVGGKGMIKADEIRAIELLQAARDGGDAIAFYNLAILYENGFGPLLLPNINKALEYYKESAEKGYQPAGIALQKFFEKNKQLADAGNIAAKCIVGCMYYNGFGVQQDYKQAFSYTKAAADADNKEALHNLGIHYQQGHGIEKQDLQMAFAAHSAAAQKGLASSQRIRGEMLLQGIGTAQDKIEAFEWIQMAAQQGDATAMTSIGIMCFHGIGTRVNEKLARSYLEVAIENGYSKAQEVLRTLDRRKSPDSPGLPTHGIAAGVSSTMYTLFQSAMKYVAPANSGGSTDEEIKLLKDGGDSNRHKTVGNHGEQEITTGVVATCCDYEGLRRRRVHTNTSLAATRTERMYAGELDPESDGQSRASSVSSRSSSEDDPLKTLELSFGHLDVEYQRAIDELRPVVSFKELLQRKQCDKYIVAKLIIRMTQKYGSGVKVAQAIGITPQELSKLKNPMKYSLYNISPIVRKAWQWFQETPIERITDAQLAGITEKELTCLF